MLLSSGNLTLLFISAVTLVYGEMIGKEVIKKESPIIQMQGACVWLIGMSQEYDDFAVLYM